MLEFFDRINRMNRVATALVLLMVTAATAHADITLPSIFSNGMVLQRGDTAAVWGTGADGETVSVSFRGKTVNGSVKAGKWRVDVVPGNYSVTETQPAFMVDGLDAIDGVFSLVNDRFSFEELFEFAIERMPGGRRAGSSPVFGETVDFFRPTHLTQER